MQGKVLERPEEPGVQRNLLFRDFQFVHVRQPVETGLLEALKIIFYGFVYALHGNGHPVPTPNFPREAVASSAEVTAGILEMKWERLLVEKRE